MASTFLVIFFFDFIMLGLDSFLRGKNTEFEGLFFGKIWGECGFAKFIKFTKSDHYLKNEKAFTGGQM